MNLNQVGQIERKTQDRVVNLFQTLVLDYKYLGNWEDRQWNSQIEEEYLKAYLTKKWYSEKLIKKAIYEITKIAWDQSKSLYDVNKEVYRMLRYWVKVKEDIWDNNQTVWLIDWTNPLKNDFAIAEEVTVRWQHTKRPDIVIYVNGIALWVIELKRSKVSVSEWIRQNLDNQKEIFIKQFFSTIQFVTAWNDTEWLRYWCIETPEKYYLSWKEETYTNDNALDRQILQLFDKKKFLELIHDFVVFDKWIKKVCRHNQYFWVKASQESLKNKEWWIIWHTQWSWKSLTMVWLAKWIKENIRDSRILIITDRDELDKQIKDVFLWVEEDIYRTKSWRDLIDKINDTLPTLICSLVHKFKNKNESDFDWYVNDLKNNMPKNFKPKWDIYVFVDECHRTQSGKLHEAMKFILPNAIFVGFTGTPLLKKDKQKSIEVFWKYLHTYKFDEAVQDNVILDLRYEARDIDQKITSQDKIDQWFEVKTKWLTDYAKKLLKKRWWTMQKVLSSQSRLEKIVADILLDMELKERLQNGKGNAMLIAWSIYEACKYYELFQNHGFKKCAIISSYSGDVSTIKWETTWNDEESDNILKYTVYQKMLNWKDPEIFEDEVKKKFIKEPWQMKLLIVVDKLLTWFDAPSATYLYIDKSMRDHWLFQAICRVNRLDWDDKEYWYVIDYKDLFKKVENAVSDYTSCAFDSFEKEDVAWLLTDRLKKWKERLDEALETIRALCEPVEAPKDTMAYIRYFCSKNWDSQELKDNEQRRANLYKYSVSLIRSYANIANEMIDAWYSENEVIQIKREVQYYSDIRDEISLASGDYIDLKSYEPAMRHLIDSYISSESSKKVSAFDDMTLLQLIIEKWVDAIKELPKSITCSNEAIAETIENNVRKVIIDEQDVNPKYYEKMSVLLDELIKRRKEKALEYEEYLRKIVELTKQVKNPLEWSNYPKSLDTNAKKALYDNLWQHEELALAIDETVRNSKQDGFRGNRIKERMIVIALKKVLDSFDVATVNIEDLFELIKNQRDY